MLKTESDGDTVKLLGVVFLNLLGLVMAQLNNYYNWPDSSPPVVKTEVHTAGKETRIRCHIKEQWRHIQNGLNLSWEFKPCRAGNAAPCMDEGVWQRLCGGQGTRCPSILTLLEPRSQNSGLYRCHITLDGTLISLNMYMLQFTDNKREPPLIVEGMNANVTVVAPKLASLQCKVRSPVPPMVKWFRRLESNGSPPNLPQTRYNFIQYLNNSYQLLNCCPVAALSQKDLYLSKLVISSSSVYDSGFYICLVINNVNYTLKETYIGVLPLLKASNEKVQTGSFLMLFLIPVMFALIPALAWVMCLRPRKLPALTSSMTPKTRDPVIVQTHVIVSNHRVTCVTKPMDCSYTPVTIVPKALKI